jgi:hypothetical protein
MLLKLTNILNVKMAYQSQGMTPLVLGNSGSPSYLPNNLAAHGDYLVNSKKIVVAFAL